MTGLVPLLTIICTLFGVLLKSWQDGKPARVQEDVNEAIQKGRADIAGGNSAAVTERIDSLLTVQTSATSGSAGRVGNDPVGESDAITLARVAALGLGTGAAAGESGKV